MAIDPDLLPARALFDTGVLIRALRQKQDADSIPCQDLFDAMLANGREIIVAAPTLAEMYRAMPQGAKPKPLPRFPGVEVIAFDERAARVVGAELPMGVLRKTNTAAGTPLSYLKADAMIVACGKIGSVACIVALDADLHALAPQVGIAVRRPIDFEKKQVEMALPPRK